MKVFISWSGHRSGAVASALQLWIPRVIQFVRPWISSQSIDAGSRWSSEIAGALEETRLGVICLTSENLSSPWILFEAGALSKAVTETLVIPYLLDFEARELERSTSSVSGCYGGRSGYRPAYLGFKCRGG